MYHFLFICGTTGRVPEIEEEMGRWRDAGRIIAETAQ